MKMTADYYPKGKPKNEDTGSKSFCNGGLDAAGQRKFEEGGWCKFTGKCEHKHRVYQEGPRGGMRRTDSFMCQAAI
jgi:hypothetical protein